MKTYNLENDLCLSDFTESEPKAIEYCGSTARTVMETYYPDLFDAICRYDFEDYTDFEDWLNQKTHFKFDGNSNQWESWTLDLISQEGGE